MSKLLSTSSVSVVFMYPCDVRTRDNPRPHHHHPPPLPPESTTQNNAHFNMCRWGALFHCSRRLKYSPHHFLHTPASRKMALASHSFRCVSQSIVWRTFLFATDCALIYFCHGANGYIRIAFTYLYVHDSAEKWCILHSVSVTLRSRIHFRTTDQWDQTRSFVLHTHTSTNS